MAFKGNARVGFRHAAAVVDYMYACLAGVDYYHVDLCGLGVERVFHKLFYYRCRALYYFSGGYLVGHGVGKQMYYVGHVCSVVFMLCPFPAKSVPVSLLGKGTVCLQKICQTYFEIGRTYFKISQT